MGEISKLTRAVALGMPLPPMSEKVAASPYEPLAAGEGGVSLTLKEDPAKNPELLASLEKFNKKVQQAADIYSKLEVAPGYYVNGEISTGEVMADLGGLTVAVDIAQKKGYDTDWIHQRLLSIRVRNELTAEWQERGVQQGKEYIKQKETADQGPP